MELLGDVGHVESCFGPIRDGVRICAREVHGFARIIPLAQKSFLTHLMVRLGDKAKVEARFGLFGDSANLDAG
jgi:hypothetical protein